MNNSLTLALLTFILAFFLLILVKSKQSELYPYIKNPYFISKAEQSFMKVLEQITVNNYYIFAQISLISLIKTDMKGKEYWSYFNKIKQKSVDFVLVDKTTFKPLLVIELDDRSHSLAIRTKRDLFLDKALANAGIKLLRQKTQYSYNIRELSERIYTTLQNSPNI